MKNYWNLSLAVSLIVHTSLLLMIPGLVRNIASSHSKSVTKEIEIIPQKIKELIRPQVREDVSAPDVATSTPPPYLDNVVKEVLLDTARDITLDKARTIDGNLKDAILAELPSEKELTKNTAYMDYYQLIRERIRANAYHYYESERIGEVFLTFIILHNGVLNAIYLNEQSNKNRELVEIALKSIKDAAPFPPFPKDLNYPKLQFNISIYFKSN